MIRRFCPGARIPSACVRLVMILGTLSPALTEPSHGQSSSQAAPLIDTIPADLAIPPLSVGEPRPGKRVREVLPRWKGTDVHHLIYLPTDHRPSIRYPLIVEFAGNGGFRNELGDTCTGLPEGSKLGFGATAGEGFLWACLPFLRADSKRIATRWWGDAPEYDPTPTVEYCKAAIRSICDRHQGDPERIVLAGFSRGAIACNFVGLGDDDIARLWCGFIVYSHYDGVRRWPYPGSDRASAITRLKRLGDRPQIILHETNGTTAGLAATRSWLASTGVPGSFTFVETGFRNHNDAWTLRPSEARRELRSWISQFR